MPLFDEIKRNNDKFALYGEPLFAYLNRNARVEFDKFRYELEEWFAHYPASGQADLRERFRSEIDSQHKAAFFELFLHELLLRLGCRVTLHPAVPNLARTPDFLVESPDSERFYLEATVATNESNIDVAANRRIEEVYDVVNRKVKSPDFFLAIGIISAPATPPPARRIASFINAHLAELNYDEIRSLLELGHIEELPKWKVEREGWKIEIEPIPKSREARGRPGDPTIGLYDIGAQLVNYGKFVRKKITEKARRYGKLDLPFVIAMNVLEYLGEFDIFEALFGKEQLTARFPKVGPIDQIDSQWSRLPDGAWTAPTGPRYTRVSAILLATQLDVYNFSQSALRLYHNPWAQRPYMSVLTRLPQVILRDRQMELIEGKSTSEVFGLPPSWSEEPG